MYSNNSKSVRDALCFFLDEEKGHEFGFVQFPQAIENLTKNDVYSSSFHVFRMVSINKQPILISKYFIKTVSLPPWLPKILTEFSAYDMPCNKGGASRV
jgi:hypothetical protein